MKFGSKLDDRVTELEKVVEHLSASINDLTAEVAMLRQKVEKR